jgi:hypothetical protein
LNIKSLEKEGVVLELKIVPRGVKVKLVTGEPPEVRVNK